MHLHSPRWSSAATSTSPPPGGPLRSPSSSPSPPSSVPFLLPSLRSCPSRFSTTLRLRCSPTHPSTISSPLSSALRGLDPSSVDALGDDAIDFLVSPLTPKEQTLVLKRQRDWRLALRVFCRMRSQAAYVPNPIHYNVVLRTLGRSRRWDELRLCWIDMAKDGVLPTNNTYATLIDAYAKAGLVKEALLWLRHMKSRGVFPDEVTMSTVLRTLKDSGQFDEGERFYRGWCAGTLELDFLELDYSGLEMLSPKHFVLSELFKTGCRAPASRVALASNTGPQKPRLAATFNTLINMYGKAGRLKDASDAFAAMLRSGIAPDTITFNTMINVCGTHRHLAEAEQLLDKMDKRRVPPDTKTFNIFMTMYASVRDTEAVLKYYHKIREAGLHPDTVSHRILLQVLCERKMVRELQDVIEDILESGDGVDEQSVPVIMKMYIDIGSVDEANMFFKKHCSSRELSSKNYAAIIDAYAEKGLWEEAELIFYGERKIGYKKDITEYNVMIKAYGRGKQYDKALLLFETMRRRGTWPDDFTYNSLIQMLSVADLPERARDLLERMKKAGFAPRCETFSAVIASFSRKCLVSEAVELYEDMKASGVEANEIVYGSLIDMFAEAGQVEEALHYCNLMEQSGCTLNRIVLTSLIKAYGKASCWEEAQDLYSRLKNMEEGPDIIASNCMLNIYANLGMVIEANTIFQELRRNFQADSVSYATMMYLYKNMGMLDVAVDVARGFRNSGLIFDCTSYNATMACFAGSGELRDCAELLLQMREHNISPDSSTFKTVFTVLKKGGMASEAVMQLESSYNIESKPYAKPAIVASLFSMVKMHTYAVESCESFLDSEFALDSCAYNVAINAYGSSGDVDKALNLVMKMQDEGVKPDLVTYIYLAGCYGKAGMVEGVKRIYSLLKYGEIGRNESLYKALIDAYRDCGRHDLAELVDQEMKFSICTEEFNDPESEGD